MIIKFQIKVGDPVATYCPGSWGDGTYSTGYVVAKITPSGQVVIRRKVPSEFAGANADRRFDSNGYEMGSSSSFSRTRLVPLEEANKAIELRAKRNAIQKAFSDISAKANSFRNFSGGDRDGYTAAVVELETLVAEARKAAEAM